MSGSTFESFGIVWYIISTQQILYFGLMMIIMMMKVPENEEK